MYITFYLAGAKVRATSLSPTPGIPGQSDFNGYRIETYFPSTKLLKEIEISKVVKNGNRRHTDLHVYSVQDWAASTSDPLCNQVISVKKITRKRNEFFDHYPALLNGRETEVKLLDTLVPHVIWVDKKDSSIHLLRGGQVEDGVYIDDPQMPIQLLKSMMSIEDIDHFRGEFYDIQNNNYNHLGFLKVLFIEGRTGGALYRIAEHFLRSKEIVKSLQCK